MWVNFVCLVFGFGDILWLSHIGVRVHNGRDYMGASSRHGDWSGKLRNKQIKKIKQKIILGTYVLRYCSPSLCWVERGVP